MKYLAALLFVVLLGVAIVHSAPPPGDGAGVEAPGLFGYTPVPKSTPATAAAPGKKVPLTASLAKDDKGKSPATAFVQADTEYLLWKDPTGAKGDTIRTVWYAVDTGKVFPKNKKLSEFTQTLPGPGAIGTSISPTIKGGLPPGKYRADVYENTKVAVSLPFTITK